MLFAADCRSAHSHDRSRSRRAHPAALGSDPRDAHHHGTAWILRPTVFRGKTAGCSLISHRCRGGSGCRVEPDEEDFHAPFSVRYRRPGRCGRVHGFSEGRSRVPRRRARLLRSQPTETRLKEHLLASHTTNEQVGRVAAEANVGALVLSHLVYFGAVTAEQWEADSRGVWDGPLVVARDLGLVF